MTTEMHALHGETQDFLGGWGVGFNPAGQSDIPDPSLLTQINALSSFNDLSFVGYPDAQHVPTSGYYMTTLGQESFTVDPWSFAHAMEGNPLYPNWDTDNLTPASFDNNTINEDIYSALRASEVRWRDRRAADADGGWPALRADQGRGALPCRTSRTSFLWMSDNDFRGSSALT